MHVVLFQKTVFWQNCKKGHFLAIFYHLSSVDVVQITSNFSRCYLLARFAWYIAQFWQLWQILKRVIFLRFFSIFISNLPPEDDVIEKKPMAEPLLQFPRRFQKSNWFCSSTLNQVLKTTPIWWVLKTHTFREKDRYEWPPSPGTLFLGFQTIQIWHIYGESTTILVAQSMYSLLEVPSNP